MGLFADLGNPCHHCRRWFSRGGAAGIFIAAILFGISYSRINAVKAALDGSIFHSKVDRPKPHRHLLHDRGAEMYILRLQGYIFFGSIQKLLERIRICLRDKAQVPLKYLILDFQRVNHLDSSAVFGITRLKQLAEASDILMVWTQVAPDIVAQLERGGLHDQADVTSLSRIHWRKALNGARTKSLPPRALQILQVSRKMPKRNWRMPFPVWIVFPA